MFLCAFCQIRIYRMKHPEFINVQQTPSTHHFCGRDCKMLWIEYVQLTGKYPAAYEEILVSEEIKEILAVKER